MTIMQLKHFKTTFYPLNIKSIQPTPSHLCISWPKTPILQKAVHIRYLKCLLVRSLDNL